MKSLSEVAYVPGNVMHLIGSGSDDTELPVKRKECGECRKSSWWAVGGLIAAVIALIAVVVVVELHTASVDKSNVSTVGALSASVEVTAASAREVRPPAVAVTASVLKPADVDPLGVVEAATTTVATRSARVELSNVIRHALGTYAAEIDVVASAQAYEAYATAPGSHVVLRLHGELVAIAKATTAAVGLVAAADLFAALDPALVSVGLAAPNLTECGTDASGKGLVHGVYVRAACIDGIVTPHDRRPSLRCYLVLEGACFTPARSRLPLSIQHDAHNAAWVFSYTSTSTYVRRRR